MGERGGRQKHNEAWHHNLTGTSCCWHQHHTLDRFIETANILWFFPKLFCIWESQIRNILYMESHMKYEGGEGQEEIWKSSLRKEAKTNYSVSKDEMRETRIQPKKWSQVIWEHRRVSLLNGVPWNSLPEERTPSPDFWGQVKNCIPGEGSLNSVERPPAWLCGYPFSSLLFFSKFPLSYLEITVFVLVLENVI